jgi:hypothetical protein
MDWRAFQVLLRADLFMEPVKAFMHALRPNDMNYFTPQNITIAVLLISNLFQIFLYFRNPQENLDKKLLVLGGKHDDLVREVADIKKTNIIEINKNIADLTSTMNDMKIAVAKLSTIIEERLPKKI